MWTAAVLAGGQARRLGGRNKARLAFEQDGPSLLTRQLALLKNLVDRTIVIANDVDAYQDCGAPVVPDVVTNSGALGAVYTAVHSAQTDRTLVVACDMPFVTEALLAHLMKAGTTADIAIPRTARGYEPLCATYSAATAGALLRRIEEKRFRLSEVATIPGLLIREIGPAELAPFGSDEVLFFNINTPDDYARAIELDGEYRSLVG